jgi:hypothetical protein
MVETLDDVLSQVRGVFADPRVALDELEAKWRFFEMEPQGKTRLPSTDNENI